VRDKEKGEPETVSEFRSIGELQHHTHVGGFQRTMGRPCHNDDDGGG
jgi:hypothetical protein